MAAPTPRLDASREFIPLAEQSDLSGPIGRWVLSTACTQARRWREEFPELGGLWVSVNLSARQLDDPGLIRDVDRALEDSGLAPEDLMLEITESWVTYETPAVLDTLRELRARGLRLAIDDFGSGYSSIGSLQHLPVTALKVDRTFVDGVDRGTEASAVARAIIKLGLTLGKQVIAEGIERQEQAHNLLALGCTLGQGYLFSPGVEASRVHAMLARATGRATSTAAG